MITRQWITTLFFIFSGFLYSQSSRSSWQSGEINNPAPLELFHSTEAFNLPTAETLKKGEMQFEISHRFYPPVTANDNSFFGLDGPVNMRLGLGYALSDKLVATLARSNVNGNVDLQIKRKMAAFNSATLPMLFSLQAGAAWNTKILGRDKTDAKNFQYYGQLIFNTMTAHKKLGVGVVPTFLYNSELFGNETRTSLTLGTYLQYYVSSTMSVLAEWNSTLDGYQNEYDAMSFGIELETGGHFFKIIFTNSALLNPSQYCTGADLRFASGDWRLGFNVTRLLAFGRTR